MKIGFFPHFSFSNRDGAILSMYNIIDVLLERGFEVVVVLPNEYHLEERLKDQRIDFVYVPMYGMRMTIDQLTALSRMKFEVKYIHNQLCVQKIARILKDKQIDCIHLNGLDSSVGAKVAKLLKIPYVWHIRAFLEEDLGKTLCHQKETYRLAKEADAVIGISKDIRQKFEETLGRPVQVIYNGIPKDRYDIPGHEILSGGTIRLLLAGRISLQKGQMTAVKAVEMLVREGMDNLRLTLIGQGETKEYLKQVKDYLTEHHLEQYVQLLEQTDDLLFLRGQNDIGLTCSKREAFGRVTVENMMAGLLAVGADSGGTPEIITDGETGLLYEPDKAESLAEVIRNVARDPERARAIARKGYRYSMEHFTIERVVDELIQVYQAVTD